MQNHEPGQTSALVPSCLAATTQQFEQMQSEYHDQLQRYNAINPKQPENSSLFKLSRCNCRRRTRHSTKRIFGIALKSEEVYAHRPHCPWFAHGDFSKSTAAQFTVCSRTVSACVQVGWQYARIRGWNTVAPHLRYHAIVLRSQSPAFMHLSHATGSISKYYEKDDQEGLGRLLETTVLALLKCFGERSSPTDVNEYGKGLLDVSTAMMGLQPRLTFRGIFIVYKDLA
jgi:hypothetical protein